MTLYDRKNENVIIKQTGCVKKDLRKEEIQKREDIQPIHY